MHAAHREARAQPCQRAAHDRREEGAGCKGEPRIESGGCDEDGSRMGAYA